MNGYRIPFNRPSIVGSELEYIQQAIGFGHISGDGDFSKRCHALLESELGVARALLTTSCTHALEMAALLLDIAPGDEVIVPSFTFVSTVNAFVLRGAQPVFADIRPDTLNLDEAGLERLINRRTRAVVPVHYAGVGCQMDLIMQIASQYGLAVVEDNAHGLFGRYRGKQLGTFGQLATQSFHETKNIISGEGGALLINDANLAERAEILREKGTDRSRFFRGQVDKYGWVDLGSSYLPSDIIAAFLLAQLEQRERIQARRAVIWTRYAEALGDWAELGGIGMPIIPADCQQPFHMFYLRLRNLDHRQSFIRHMADQGILCAFHYLPLHNSLMGQRLGGRPGDCPVTELVSDQLVRLPLFYDLSDLEQEEVIATALAFAN
jgi:dTDP-4-amino-4,6-dideoxygalactose transaminase